MPRSLVLLAAAFLAALVLAPASLAVDVHLRVEGKTATIFGPTQPLVATPGNALAALESAALLGEFYYHVATSSFGSYVDQIGLYSAAGTGGWVFKVNGASPPVGADKIQLANGDRVLWYWADFGVAPDGPPTLDLRRQPRNCYQVWKQDAQGKATRAAGAILFVDGRRLVTSHGRACLRSKKHGLVRAQLAGAVRSQAIR
ncbi:MAG: hypothetical protein QOE36_1854 [Gaiellaceae bacterium]|nr:hypothetical protein [Gaiellaceae bacterium]